MKKLIGFLVLATAIIVVAGDVTTVTLDSTDKAAIISGVPGMTTGTIVTATLPADGFVQQVELISVYGAAQTCSVVVVTSTDFATQVPQVIYSNLTLTGSVLIRPMEQPHMVTGELIGATTNSYVPIFLAGDVLKAYFWASTGTNNCSVKVRVDTWR